MFGDGVEDVVWGEFVEVVGDGVVFGEGVGELEVGYGGFVGV